MKYSKLFLCLMVIPLHLTAKVLIITHHYNRPDFIEIQVKTFKAFLQDEYEYVVFNDACDKKMMIQIEEMCQKYGIRCFRIPQDIHAQEKQEVWYRHMDGIAYALQQIGYNHDGIVVLLDSDMFLIKSFSVENFLRGYDIAGKICAYADEINRLRHLAPNLIFMNMQTLPNKHTLSFEGHTYINGLKSDVGGNTYYYLKNNPSVKPLFFNYMRVFGIKQAINCQLCQNMTCSTCVIRLMDNSCDDTMVTFIQSCPDDSLEFAINNTFLHYRNGSNWNNRPQEYHTMKTNALNNFINSILQESH